MACILRPGVRAWRHGILPFTIREEGFNGAALRNIDRAIEHWNRETDWQVVPRTRQNDHATFRIGDVCSSPIGRQGGQQFVNLSNRCSFGAAVHEIGHTIGFHHEQNRSDRDGRVVVVTDRIESSRINNFTRVSSITYMDHGEYDYGSIMHYGRAGFLKAKRYNWSSGWSIARHFTVGDRSYLFLLKEQTGTMRIHKLEPGIGVSHEVERADWPSGWTNAEFYRRFDQTYLFLLKSGTGLIHVHRMNNDGTVGRQVDRRDWSSGWTTAEFWEDDDTTYFLHLKRSNGSAHIHRMNANGRIGAATQRSDWSSGWTTAKAFEAGGSRFLLLLKESSGTAHIHPVNSDGTLGPRVHSYSWSRGWTTARFFYRGSGTYLLLLKERTGDVHVHRINPDGGLGTRIDDRDWSSGWTAAEIYTFGSTNYLFLLKESSGAAHLRRMTGGSKIGDELKMTPAVNLYAPSAIGQRRGLSPGDIVAANDRI